MNKVVKRWFYAVREAVDDLDNKSTMNAVIEKIAEASEYYKTAMEDAEKDLLKVGRLEDLVLKTTSMAFFYKGVSIDIQQTRSYLEMVIESYKSRKYTWYTLDEEGKQVHGKLTATEANNLVKGEEAVEIINDCVRVLANHQNHFENIVSCFERRGHELKTISDLRNSGNHEVWIDETKETIND